MCGTLAHVRSRSLRSHAISAHYVTHQGTAIPFTIVRSDRRTLAVTVTREGAVVVRAPRRLAERRILEAVHDRSAWIARMREKAVERAQLRQEPLDPAELTAAKARFSERLDACWAIFGRPGETKPELRVRVMRSRWGSLSPQGRMTLNAWLVRAPEPCLDYVIFHELCHLRERGHGPAFYRELGRYVTNVQDMKRALRNLHW